MKTLVFGILLFILPIREGFFLGNKIYVATSAHGGNDGNPGTKISPIATIGKLNTMISGFGAGDSIFFYGGDAFDGTISGFGNGSAGNPVVITNYANGSRATLNGFTTLSSWVETSSGSHIWQTSCNSGTFLDLVTVNGVMVPMGRTPNLGSYYTVDSHSGLNQVTSSSIGGTNFVGARIVLKTSDYTTDRNVITSQSGNTLNFTSQSNHSTSDGNKFFIQAHPSTLNLQNEWYYNPATNVISFYSTVNPAGLLIQAGTSNYAFASTNRSYLKFKNLTFVGYDSIAIKANFSNVPEVDNCIFNYMGADAISTERGTGSIVTNSSFTNIGNTAIVSRYVGHVNYSYNYINGCGIIEGMGLSNNQQRNGIMHENADENSQSGDVINYNTVLNVGYCGIRFSGSGTEVAFNYVDNFGLQASDGGGIYTCCNDNLPLIRSIHDNVVLNGRGNHDMNQFPGNGGMPGIYLDDNSGKVDIYNNTVAQCTRYPYFGHNQVNVNIHNNTFFGDNNVNSNIGFEDDPLGIAMTGNNVYNNIFYITASKPQIYYLSYNNSAGGQGDNPVSSFGTLSGNLYLRSTGTNQFQANPGASYTLSGWQSAFSWDGGSTYKVVKDDSVHLFINTSSTTQTQYFPGVTYRTLNGVNHTDNITLASLSSQIGLRVTYVPDVPGSVITPTNQQSPKRKKNVKI